MQCTLKDGIVVKRRVQLDRAIELDFHHQNYVELLIRLAFSER